MEAALPDKEPSKKKVIKSDLAQSKVEESIDLKNDKTIEQAHGNTIKNCKIILTDIKSGTP